MNPPEDDHRQTGEETPRPETRALVPYDYRSDEIDLVEVGVSLWRRWKLMAGVFLICLGIGLALAFIIPKSYNYTAIIRLGSYTKADGSTSPVISAGSAAATLNNGFIGIAIQQYIGKHAIDPRKIRISAVSGGTAKQIIGNTVMLSGKAPTYLGGAYQAVEQAASDMLIHSAAAQINVIRANIQQKLSQAQIALARIEDPQRIKADKAALQQGQAAKKAALASLKQQLSVLKEKRARLNDAEKLYTRQEKELNAYLSKARQAAIAASDAGSPTQAMAVLLLNNQIQQNLRQLNAIEEKLTVSLPQQIVSTTAAIADNAQKQAVAQNALDQAGARLANFDAKHQRDIAIQKANIDVLKTRLDNVQATRLIVPPTRSIEPVGLRRSVIAILGAVVGVILALLAAAGVNYLAAVRRRLQPEERSNEARPSGSSG